MINYPSQGAYLGLRLPGGDIPKGLRGDIRQKENDWLNDDTYLSYMWRLYSIAVSVFKWNDLPKGINARIIERWMLANGICLFCHDDGIAEDPKLRSPSGYAILRLVMNGQFDIYNIPEKRVAYSVDPEHTNIYFDSTDSVIMFNNALGTPDFMTLDLYAKALWQCERTIYTNIAQQKTPRIVRCNEKQLLTMKNIMAQVDGFMPTVWTSRDVDMSTVDVLDTVSPYVADKVQIVKHQIWNEALSFLGIENTNTDKRERQVSDEVKANMGDVEAQRWCRLVSREQACEEINELFGLDVSVEFRSGQYVRTDETGDMESTERDETQAEAREVVEAETPSLWKQIKQALKGGSR